MWMGLRLIQPSKQKEEEGIDHQYIDELLQMSFFQNADKHNVRFFPYLKMHDLVHDLALFVARPEYNMLNFDGKNISTRVRHVSISEAD